MQGRKSTAPSTTVAIPAHPLPSHKTLARHLLQYYATLRQWIHDDWSSHKYLGWGAMLIVLTLIPVSIYYFNYPQVETNPDTSAYMHVVDRIHFFPLLLVDTWRLPGYPLLIVLVEAVTGANNLAAVSIVQAALFVLATVEIYSIAILIQRRAWLAFLIGLLVGTNLIILSYVKPIMSESLALWLLTNVALCVVYFIRTRSQRAFALITVGLLPLILTRPEWVYLPIPLFAYLWLVSRQQGNLRHIVRPTIFSLAWIYAIVGLYIGLNAGINHYAGLSAIENYNWMGKVLQYNMQDEVSPQDAALSQQIDYYITPGDRDPYHLLPHIPELSQNNATPAGQFARGIVLHHPIEFMLKSIPATLDSLTAYYEPGIAPAHGPLNPALAQLKAVDHFIYTWNILFPGCALLWIILLCWRKTRKDPLVLTMGGIILLVLYGLLITTLGGYRLDDYMRVHTVFNPLLILVVWGSLLIGVHILIQKNTPGPLLDPAPETPGNSRRRGKLQSSCLDLHL